MATFDSILVTTDFSDLALPGVLRAGELAADLGARLTVVYIVEDRLPSIMSSLSREGYERVLEEHRRHAAESLSEYVGRHLPGRQVELRIAVGTPHMKIVETAVLEKVDLLVLATHGHGAFGAMVFGSTAQRVVHDAPCPVMLVRSHD